ncbi:MAG: transglutaminase domain-containing protein [Bacillota bacterium]|nr:transglutaminase domain-containing protein [Bacillota bacterium]
MKGYYRKFIFLLTMVLFFAGCSQTSGTAGMNSADSTREAAAEKVKKPSPMTLSVEAVADPSVAAEDITDPYMEINKYALEIHRPDRDLYNMLFRAADDMKKSVDISAFNLSFKEKVDTAECLLSEAGCRFFYLKNYKISKDGKTATLIYTGNMDENKRNKEIFYSRLSHLLNNVAPKNYTDMQKFLAVYEYLCETSNYSHDIKDPATFSPYSILVKGEGICGGYANLMAYTMNRLNVRTEYVCNEPHAWNIIMLDGKWYNTDVTWGAGSAGSMYNYVNFVLMNDKQRLESLENNGTSTKGIILGYPRDNPTKPPACTDESFSGYCSIFDDYAMDIEHSKVYLQSDKGIECMNLDCTGRSTIAAAMKTIQMAYFNGILYFINADDNLLYSMIPGEKPELIDGKMLPSYIKLSGTELVYGVDPSGADSKFINLLPVDLDKIGEEDIVSLSGTDIPRTCSFSFNIKFSSEVGTSQNWNESVYLVDSKGNTIPLHFELSADGGILSVRPEQCISDNDEVSLIIKKDIISVDGAELASPYRMDVKIR